MHAGMHGGLGAGDCPSRGRWRPGRSERRGPKGFLAWASGARVDASPREGSPLLRLEGHGGREAAVTPRVRAPRRGGAPGCVSDTQTDVLLGEPQERHLRSKIR